MSTSDSMLDQIEIGTQVTTPHGIGIVTWVEVGADEYAVLLYSMGGGIFEDRTTVRVDRDHIAFWPPRKAAE